MITGRSLSRSHLFVTGTILVVLGIGNYVAGTYKTAHYQEVIADRVPQTYIASPFLLREAGRPFPNDAWERWEIARAKLDFYRVVQSGGRLMTTLGMICTLLALLRLRNQDVPVAEP
jgi:hypothetical protein